MGMAMADFLPFSAIYIELYYIFASVWGHRIYTIYSLLFIVFIILIIVLCKPRSFSDTWFAFATDSFNCLLASAQHFSLFVTFTGRSNASKKKSIFLLLPQEFC
ncbi:hypothetical protein HID58_021531 [Brassica napus]|uniref:Transmembrane 9 superfamily member n=1 Tax=Brassica napus TaxID=3708 RepID=A0ABQ8CWW9_BRANA|nr:hypothetical protein HID58_021531 [Brassica napus]